MFTYGSICSGIEAVTVAWKGLGKPLWFSEIEPFPCAVLAHHYPDVPNFGDMTTLAEKILKQEIPAPDVLVGGTPCFAAGHLVLTEFGYKPIEDIKVGDLVVTHKGRLKPVLRIGSELKEVGKLSAVGLPDGIICTPKHPFYSQEWKSINTRLNGKYHRKTLISEPEWISAENMSNKQWVSLTQFSVPPKTELHSKLHESITPTLKARMETGGNNVPCVVLNDQGGQSINIEKDCISPTLRSEAHGNLPIITTPYTIRKLTPTECERLQGFPDNYTQIPWRNKPSKDCPDSPRYKAIGNSMAVPVMRWIGQKLTEYLEK